MNLKKIPIYSTGENCVFIWKLFNKGTADEYDDMFTSGCNLIEAESKAECGAYFTVVVNLGKFRGFSFSNFFVWRNLGKYSLWVIFFVS